MSNNKEAIELINMYLNDPFIQNMNAQSVLTNIKKKLEDVDKLRKEKK